MFLERSDQGLGLQISQLARNLLCNTSTDIVMCGRVPPPHATEVAFFGLLRHRTRVDVVQEMFIGV